MDSGRCVAGSLAAVALAAAWLLPARAQEPAAVPAVVVTAARSPQPIDETLPSTAVITREDIERAQATDLVELLGQQGGVEFARSGGAGSQASVFMRGTNSNQVLVLIDGVRLNTALSGAATLGGISTDSIERIEISRGNLSSLYGSEAIGGVIQIFTRGGEGPGAGATAEAGQGRTRDASASVTTSLGAATLSVSGGFREQKAISAIDAAAVVPNPSAFVFGANPDLDGNRNRNGSLRIAHRDDANEIGAWAWGQHNDTDFDSIFDGPAATHVEHASVDAVGAYARHRFGASTLGLTLGETRDDAIDASNVPFAFTNGEFRSRNRQAALQDTVRWGGHGEANIGLEHLSQQGGASSYDPTFSNLLTSFERRVDSAWIGASDAAGRQQWQLNLRRDRYTDFGSATTGLAGWGYALTGSLRLTAQASNAFRAPSFNDLYYPGFSNRALRPERAGSEELGLRYAQGALRASLEVFHTRMHDMIVFDPVTFVPQNIGRTAIDGAELQASAASAHWVAAANLTLTHARDADTGQALVRRARFAARASATWENRGWSAGGDVSRVGGRDDFDINSGAPVRLAPYTLARLRFARDVAPGVRLRLRIENAFDAKYRLVDGYNTLPRLIIGGVEVRI